MYRIYICMKLLQDIHDVMLSAMFLLLIYCTLLFLHVQIQICNSFDSEEL